MKDNEDYPEPDPSLNVVSDSLQAFATGYTQANLGGVVLTSAKNARRAALVAVVRQLAIYVAAACRGDYTKLLGSGFPAHKPVRQTIGQLSQPQTPKLTHGDKSGEIIGTTKPVRGVFVYNWQLALASDSDTILKTAQSTGRKVTFTGLTPGQVYVVKVNAVGAAGPADFSDVGRLMSL